MYTLKSKLTLAALLAAALLAGCGGNDHVQASVPTTPTTLDVAQMLSFINDLIANAGSNENSDLVDVNAITLVEDDTADAAAI
jgi:ABC-type glycerol-3-phosphate transport system substrate-binding protein